MMNFKTAAAAEDTIVCQLFLYLNERSLHPQLNGLHICKVHMHPSYHPDMNSHNLRALTEELY